jgi:hypothetical protein
MDRTALEHFLPAFAIIFVCLVSVWAYFRRRKPVRIVYSNNEEIARLKSIDGTFRVMLSAAVLVVFVYAYFPEQYQLFAPIEFLDHPIINSAGVLILKVSLVWIVLAQLNIDKSVFMINEGCDEWSHKKLLGYSQRLLLAGILVMIIGLFVTISNLVTVLMSLIGIVVFRRLWQMSAH